MKTRNEIVKAIFMAVSRKYDEISPYLLNSAFVTQLGEYRMSLVRARLPDQEKTPLISSYDARIEGDKGRLSGHEGHCLCTSPALLGHYVEGGRESALAELSDLARIFNEEGGLPDSPSAFRYVDSYLLWAGAVPTFCQELNITLSTQPNLKPLEEKLGIPSVAMG